MFKPFLHFSLLIIFNKYHTLFVWSDQFWSKVNISDICRVGCCCCWDTSRYRGGVDIHITLLPFYCVVLRLQSLDGFDHYFGWWIFTNKFQYLVCSRSWVFSTCAKTSAICWSPSRLWCLCKRNSSETKA